MLKHNEINIRNIRFASAPAARWWLAGDPVATAWHNALSASFPRGEAYFIEAVRANRAGTTGALARQIDAFIAQEANHSREHHRFNRHLAEAGYDMAGIDAALAAFMAENRSQWDVVNLAATIALEHFTAIIAHDLLARPDYLAGAEPEMARLWRWHAVEEIEHKAVAFDTWLHATRRWSGWQRWRLRCLVMLKVSRNFLTRRSADALCLLAQDGITGWRARARLAAYLLGKPGVIRRILPVWCGFFRPGFHPWQTDDRALIAAVDLQAGV
ncbi:MAG TPA: metal-dependent hydrolase [Novosphingobium sp.]|nr:metal-dependent hydrolase [Novosphingobium sp.]HZV08446.1 metal-dependent hydrolase [Novosphingobium sp.]